MFVNTTHYQWVYRDRSPKKWWWCEKYFYQFSLKYFGDYWSFGEFLFKIHKSCISTVSLLYLSCMPTVFLLYLYCMPAVFLLYPCCIAFRTFTHNIPSECVRTLVCLTLLIVFNYQRAHRTAQATLMFAHLSESKNFFSFFWPIL